MIFSAQSSPLLVRWTIRRVQSFWATCHTYMTSWLRLVARLAVGFRAPIQWSKSIFPGATRLLILESPSAITTRAQIAPQGWIKNKDLLKNKLLWKNYKWNSSFKNLPFNQKFPFFCLTNYNCSLFLRGHLLIVKTKIPLISSQIKFLPQKL